MQVQISNIIVDPNQPRQFYNDLALQELSQSIKVHGVIQPVLLRSSDEEGKFLLVCGERRLRASVLAELTDIPATVKEMDDRAALEVQIIENLQRKDPHPMEEAVAFKRLIEEWDASEIANRVGRSLFFVKQRLKLNELTEQWQQHFFKSKMSIKHAIQMAALPPDVQTAWYEEDKEEDGSYSQSLEDYQFRNYNGKLNEARFDLTDVELVPDVGACINCKYNSACNVLFEEVNPICSNLICFKNKQSVHLLNKVNKFIEEEHYFISRSGDIDQKVEELLKENNINVLGWDGYREIESDPGKLLSKEGWIEEEEYDLEEWTEEEIKEDYEDYVEEHKKSKESFEKSSPFALRALFLSGSDKGNEVLIKLTSKGKTKLSSDANIPNSEQIEKIKEREKRAKELDDVKVFKALVSQDNLLENYTKDDSELTDLETKALYYIFLKEALSWQQTENYNKISKLKLDRWSNNVSDFKTFKKKSISAMKIPQLIRMGIVSKMSSGHEPNHRKNSDNAFLFEIMSQRDPALIKMLSDAQKVKTTKRMKGVKARISKLKTKEPVASK